jgi:AraC-like DNA-binding protein
MRAGGTRRGRGTEPADHARLWQAADLGGLELLQASYGRFAFTPHSHEGFLVAVTEGGVGGPVFRGEQHQVGPGDVLVLHPEQAHAGGPLTDAPWRYRALYPGADLMARIATELRTPDGSGSRPAAGPRFPEGVVRDLQVARRLRRFHLATGDPRATALQRESRLVEGLAWLIGRHAAGGAQATPPGREHRAVRAAREYLDEHATENLSLVQLAGVAGLSPFHLCRLFHREVGLTPHAYQTQVRIRRARRLLRDGVPIAITAAATGFYDQAHLTRHFKRTVGVTPRQYASAG